VIEPKNVECIYNVVRFAIQTKAVTVNKSYLIPTELTVKEEDDDKPLAKRKEIMKPKLIQTLQQPRATAAGRANAAPVY
jgi:hypothetical protein